MHLMVDIECMDNAPTAAIVSIGAVVFDPDGNDLQLVDMSRIGGIPPLERSFYVNIDLPSCQKLGLTIGGKTVMWWLEQSQEARDALKTPTPIPLRDALSSFCEFVRKESDGDQVYMWSHATFDAPILHNAFFAIGRPAPWNFRNCFDLRTLLRDAGSPMIADLPELTAHDALWDAWRQVLIVQACQRLLTPMRGYRNLNA